MSRTCANGECGRELTQKAGEHSSAFAKRSYCDRKCAAAGRGKSATGKLQFPSQFTNKKIHITQWIAEEMCKRKARADRVTLLPYFWETSPWEKIFKFQAVKASQLLKEFSPTIIGAVLRSKEGRRIWSLAMPDFRAMCAEEAKKARHTPPATPTQLPAQQACEQPADAAPGQSVNTCQAGDLLVGRPTFNPTQTLRQKLRAVDG